MSSRISRVFVGVDDAIVARHRGDHDFARATRPGQSAREPDVARRPALSVAERLQTNLFCVRVEEDSDDALMVSLRPRVCRVENSGAGFSAASSGGGNGFHVAHFADQNPSDPDEGQRARRGEVRYPLQLRAD